MKALFLVMISIDVVKEEILATLPKDNAAIDGIMISYEQQRNYKREDVVKFIKEVVAPEKVFGNRAKEVQQKLTDFYVNRDVPENPDYKFWVQRYCDVRFYFKKSKFYFRSSQTPTSTFLS